MRQDSHLLNGLNVCRGRLTHKAVATALQQEYVPLKCFGVNYARLFCNDSEKIDSDSRVSAKRFFSVAN